MAEGCLTIADLGRRKLAKIILVYIMLGAPVGVYNVWQIGHFDSIRADATQKLEQLRQAESSTLIERTKNIIRKSLIKDELNSASPLALAGIAIFIFLIFNVAISYLILGRDLIRRRHSYRLGITFTLTYLGSILIFSALFHSYMYGNGFVVTSTLSALIFYSSMWFAWLLTGVIIFASLSTEVI